MPNDHKRNCPQEQYTTLLGKCQLGKIRKGLSRSFGYRQDAEKAVLLDTVVVNSPSKRLGENTAFMHHLYCPIYVNGEAGLAKIYVAETFGNDHKFYLLRIEKASSDMGFNYVSEVLTPDSEAASEDTVISVADIISFVKNHDQNYESNKRSKISLKIVASKTRYSFDDEDYLLAVRAGIWTRRRRW